MTNRIPSNDGGEPVSTAGRVGARCDIGEALTKRVVQQRIEETERLPAFEKLVVVKQLSSEIIPATVYIFRLDGCLRIDGKQRGRGVGRTGAAQLVPSTTKPSPFL